MSFSGNGCKELADKAAFNDVKLTTSQNVAGSALRMQQSQAAPLMWAALLAALLHIAILSLQYSPALFIQQSQQQTISILLDRAEPEPSVVSQELTEQEAVQSNPPEERTTPSVAPTPVANQATTPVISQKESDTPTISINSGAFKSFIAQETQRSINQNLDEQQAFSESFVELKQPEKQSFGPGTPLLGGGSYKVSRDGETCHSIAMVPQSFDDFTRGTMSIVGNCKPNKKVIELLNKDGSIKNSSRYD